MFKAIRNNIPNAVTSLNLLCGAVACVAAFSGNSVLCGGMTGYQWAYLLIALAAVADFLDGLTARLLHAVSAIGKELDSLADLVSFGLAPALVLYNIMVMRGADGWAMLALLLPVFGALRLARFNVSTNQTTTFTGLPIPANAIFWIGLTSCYAVHPMPLWLVVTLIVALSLLMVCNLRMFSLKMRNVTSLRQNWPQYLLLVASLALLLLMGLPGLAVVICLYVLLAIIVSLTTEKLTTDN